MIPRVSSVLWREGMFLFPQHLQAFGREVQARLQAAASLGLVGDWGVLELEVDEDALRADAFGVRRAVVVFRDGSLGCFPGNAIVETREFAEHFKGPQLDVYLGVPAVQAGVPQIGADNGRHYRYTVLRDEVPDENDREARRWRDSRAWASRRRARCSRRASCRPSCAAARPPCSPGRSRRSRRRRAVRRAT
jgi:predicted component of type VI protein secretion system